MTRAFILDVLERLAKAFVQTFGSVLVATWVASALSVPDLEHWSTWAKLLGPAIAAGGASVLSVLTSLLSGLKTGTASASMIVASTAVTPGDHAATGVLVGGTDALAAAITAGMSSVAVVTAPPTDTSVIVADPITPA